MSIADQLRTIAGQDTTPPLWIYVTKDQVPVLTKAADALDAADEERKRAFVAGVLFGAFSMQGRHAEAVAIVHEQRTSTAPRAPEQASPAGEPLREK